VERTATHDTEYVDIVLGYHHVLLFSMVFGVLIFGTGYFIGYYRARSDRADRAASTTSPAPSSPAAGLPAVQIPAMLTQPPPPAAGDVVKEMEALSTGALAPAANANANPRAASPTPQESATAAPPPTPERPSQETMTAPPPTPPGARPAAPPAAEAPKREVQPPANGKGSQPAAKPVPRAAAKPPNAAGGNIYLQVSSFGAQQEAEQLINDLAAEGFRALIDGQLVEGKHTVLVGPFSDFESAVGQAKELKQHNREAFPIRR
jgi:cell division protein FtsN